MNEFCRAAFPWMAIALFAAIDCALMSGKSNK